MTDKKPNNLTLLPGAGENDPGAELVRRADKEMKHYAKLADIEAQRKRIFYDALIENGFTPEQALALIK
jgi:hypothetical protein